MKFYDTSSLLLLQEKVFDEPFVISYCTLKELENIKTSANKDEVIKYSARNIVRLLDENFDKYQVEMRGRDVVETIGLECTNDNIIINGCYLFNQEQPVELCSDDLLMRRIASSYGLNVCNAKDILGIQDEYKGYKEVVLTEDKMAYFYENPYENQFNCLVNEYLLLKNTNGEVVDIFKWTGDFYKELNKRTFKSRSFGNVKPLDDIQKCVFDSLQTNDITLLYGKAGSGKTTIPLAYILQGLETQKFAKCHIIYHYEPLKGAKTLGFEKGDHTSKLLNSAALGNILSSKMGDIQIVESMMSAGMINIIPTANIRGVEFAADDVVFCTECQNIDTYTLKTIIQRCKEGCKQFYEGDLNQSDIRSGTGMKRMIEVFKNNNSFGCVELLNNYRSKLCELADTM